MSYLTKEEKKEYKEVKRFLGVEMTKGLFLTLILVFAIGLAGVGYKLTIGKINKDAEREVFEHSQSYVHGMVDDLAKYKLEYTRAQDDIDKRALEEVILDRYSNFDADLIEDASLRQFLLNIRNGGF